MKLFGSSRRTSGLPALITRILSTAPLLLCLAFSHASATAHVGPTLMLDTGVAENVCVLTFDDGPGPRTNELLDILKEKDVKATFFVVGTSSSNPARRQLFQRMIAEGHEIGDHTMTHRNLARSSDDEIRRQVGGVQAILESHGVKASYLRPPYGATNARVSAIADELNLPVILWSVDSYDWKHAPSFETLVSDRHNARRGVLLFHDIHGTTIDRIGSIIDALRADGARFVPLREFVTMAEAHASEKEQRMLKLKQERENVLRPEESLKDKDIEL